MRIHTIISQSRRDFRAMYVCDHCNRTMFAGGYDDDNFHRNIVPDMICEGCGKKADPETFRPLGTKYTPNEVV